jgi:hypothetical protein
MQPLTARASVAPSQEAVRRPWLVAAPAVVAYVVAHQLLSTVWNIALVAVLVAAAFGRSGGKRLVEESSTRARELRAAHRA